MIDKNILIKEIETLPLYVLEEVYDYIAFLKLKKICKNKIEDVTFASEQALAKDWLLPEEDVAWANL